MASSHGIDSLNCTLASLLETAAVGYGHGRIGAFTALVPVLPMFFSTWETYHTHTLYLGYFNGPTGTGISHAKKLPLTLRRGTYHCVHLHLHVRLLRASDLVDSARHILPELR